MTELELIILIALPILFLGSEFLLNRLAGGAQKTRPEAEEN